MNLRPAPITPVRLTGEALEAVEALEAASRELTLDEGEPYCP